MGYPTIVNYTTIIFLALFASKLYAVDFQEPGGQRSVLEHAHGHVHDSGSAKRALHPQTIRAVQYYIFTYGSSQRFVIYEFPLEDLRCMISFPEMSPGKHQLNCEKQ